MSVPIYFTFASVFGIANVEGETTIYFTLFVLLIFFTQLLLYFFTLLKGSILRSELFLLLFIFLLISLSFGIGVFYDLKLDNFYLFIIMGITGFLLYFSSVKIYSFKNISLDTYYLSLFFSWLFIFAIFKVFTVSEIFSDINLGGATYQTISYTAVLLFGLLLFLLPNTCKNKIFCLVLYFLNFITLVSLSFIMFLGGSKGAFLVFVLYLFYFFILKFRILTLLSWLAIGMSLAMLGSIITYDISIFEVGFNRILAFFDPDISMSERATGRDSYYQNFLTLFEESPFFGYGLLSSNGYVSNSHNLFTMFMLQFGFFGVIKSVFIILLLLITVLKIDFKRNLFFGVLLVHVFVMLMFSGQYFSTLLYWFVLSFMVDNLFREHST
ncbi:O-antigen ligase family protein [Alishewanella aestuarii]|nr:O-antigen ligase family protein [Alishewanella aestuarii]